MTDSDAVRLELTRTHGVDAVVRKRRHLLLWRQVRIHLDDVEGLGHFIEFEAVADDASDLSSEHGLIDELRARFAIAQERLWAGGYAEAVAANR